MPRRFPESGTQEEKVLNPSWKISLSESTNLAAKNSLAVLAKVVSDYEKRLAYCDTTRIRGNAKSVM